MKKILTFLVTVMVLTFLLVTINIKGDIKNSYKNSYVYENINVLNSYSLKANFLPLSYSEPRDCPEGYKMRTFDDKKYCVNQYENIYEDGAHVFVETKPGTDILRCIAKSVPFNDIVNTEIEETSGKENACFKLGVGWSVQDYVLGEDRVICENLDFNVCILNEYYIEYDFNAGFRGKETPTVAKVDEVIKIPNPKKIFKIDGVDVQYNAEIGNVPDIELTFDGWIFDGDVSNALYGDDSVNVNNKWSDHTNKVTSEYFKNLVSVGDTVRLTAKWKMESQKVKLPTLKKDGYKCLWQTIPNPSENSVGYIPGNEYDIDDITNFQYYVSIDTQIKLYADCIEDPSYVPDFDQPSQNPDSDQSPQIPDSSLDESLDIDDNPGTGGKIVFIVFCIALLSIGYAIYVYNIVNQKKY